MKHFAFVILLAGCPGMDDDVGSGTPPAHDPPTTCAGFGLGFSSQTFADSYFFSSSRDWGGAYNTELPPIARGGVATVNVRGYPWIAVNQWTPFDAVVNGAALAIEQPGPFMNAVRVTGEAPGHADLCIYDVDSDTVHDGRRLLVGEIDSVFVTPTNRMFESTMDSYPFAHWLLHTGKQRRLAFGMVSSENWRLVDSGMTLDLAVAGDPLAKPTHESWDTVLFDAASEATTARLRATLSSGEELEARAELTSTIDHLVRRPGYYDLAKLMVNGSSGYECFEAYRDGARVFGAPFVFTAGSNVRLNVSSAPNCIYIQAVEPGQGALVVTVDNQAMELPYTVLPTGS